MAHFIVRLLVAAAGLWLAAHLIHGVGYSSVFSLLVAALLLGLVNAVVRPVVVVLTLPFTLVTLGLFLLVVNAAMICLVALFVPGFRVAGLVPGIGAAIVTGMTSWAGHVLLGDSRSH